MNKETRKAIRKLKDNDGNYILNKRCYCKVGLCTVWKRCVYLREYAENG